MNNKKQLIHLHELFAEVINDYEARTGENIDLEEYKELGIGPTSIHRSKKEHEEALRTLASCVEDQMKEELPNERLEELIEERSR